MEENNQYTGYEIAVIGMAGRFPNAKSIDEFWENIKNGKNCIQFFSDEELTNEGCNPELIQNPLYVKAKGITEDVEFFDASFFNFTFREADLMDPQLRILHECSWKALEDAAYNPDDFEGLIGFYIGTSTPISWFAQIIGQTQNGSDLFSALSVIDSYSLSTQIAYRLNLRGPSLTIQTACSSSLIAIHTACQSLLSGECHMAMAGGVSIQVPVKNGYVYQEGMVNSPDGFCRAFDADAAGTVPGNGAAVVVLKLLETALEDKDHIYAIVKGTAINNDGNRRVGYSAPSVKGQTDVIRTAHRAAGVEPESISYVETHGTGTKLGDPIEIRALTRAFNSDKKQFCRLGAVKSNVGHMDAAAGVTGFIKTVLTLYFRMIPPSLNFKKANPEIDFENSPFMVNTELTPWNPEPLQLPRRAGVSSFGIGGANAHVILEEAPTIDKIPPKYPRLPDDYRLILLSGKTEGALERNSGNFAEFLKKNPGVNLADAAYTLQVGRKAFEYRKYLVAPNSKEAIEALCASPGNTKAFNLYSHRLTTDEPPRTVFMFSGLGGQYANMGIDLYREDWTFREEMDACFIILNDMVYFDMKEILYPGRESDNLTNASRQLRRIDISQLALFTFEYVLAQCLIQWGIEPDMMIGYSFGEYVAACISGVFSLHDALKLIVERGKLINRTNEGGMLSIPLHKNEMSSILNDFRDLSIAIDNGASCIIAGPKSSVDSLEDKLKHQRILCMRLNTSYAIHSHMMNPILDEFEICVRNIRLNAPKIPYISNVTGKRITAAEATDPHYWTKHLSSTIKFSEGVEELVKDSYSIFVELGPGRDVSALTQRYISENEANKTQPSSAQPSHRVINLVRPEQKEISDSAFLLGRLGLFWLYGKKIDWNLFYERRKELEDRYRISLPSYSFERQRFILNKGRAFNEFQSPSSHSIPGNTEPMIHAEPRITYDRPSLPDNFCSPRDEMEEKIARGFQEIFGLEQISIHDDFFELGGDSLKVISLVTNLHRQIQADIPMDAVFKNPTVKELAAYVGNRTEKSLFSSIPVAETRDTYPLSSPQKRVFIMEQIEEKGLAYTEPYLLWMDGPLDVQRLANAHKQLMKRHESLRTGFFMHDGEPVQRIFSTDEVNVEMEYYDLSEGLAPGETIPQETIDSLVKEFLQPFDLATPPLWRLGIAKISPEKHLFLDIHHHIISDDISIGIWMTELSALYRGETLEELPIQYKDYALWREKVTTADELLKKQEEFWMNVFSDAPDIPKLQLPTDFPRPEIRSFEGHHTGFHINPELYERIQDMAKKNKTTLFMFLLAVYNVLLYKYSDQEDIIVGIPITGRSHRDVQKVLGMFVNTLALRNQPVADLPFDTFLDHVKENTLGALSNQFYQFEDLVERLNLRRDTSRNPLFDTMFVLHTVDMDKIKIAGADLSPYHFEHPACRFDITMNASEFRGGLNVGLEYSTALFTEETMRQFLEDFTSILREIEKDFHICLDDIKTHASDKRTEEKKRILFEFNDTSSDFPSDKTIHEMFEDQVLKTPGNIAVIGTSLFTGSIDDNPPSEELPETGITNSTTSPTTRLTYHELNQHANRLASYLIEKGAGPDTIIGIMLERSIDMVIGLMGILKAGSAYLPIAPDYPQERIDYIIKDSAARIILTTEEKRSTLRNDEVMKVGINIENISPEIIEAKYLQTNDFTEIIVTSPLRGTPSNLAYVIYTSGSTGKPKGVAIEHRSVINRLNWMQKAYPINETDVILQKTTYTFDVSVWELFWWSFQGASVCMLGHGEEMNPEAIIETIEANKVTVMHFVPSMLTVFLEYIKSAPTDSNCIESLSSLKTVFASGEALSKYHVETFNQLCFKNNNTRLINLYGPTEATVDVSHYDCSTEAKEIPANIPIGKPIDNTQLFIFDKKMRLQGIGSAGELYIGGTGLARGYLNRPELTDERFKQDCLRRVRTFLKEGSDTSKNFLLYKTGDLAQWLPDGNIEYLGRIDFQVKIRGYRIELGEIEFRLTSHEEIKDAIVLAREDESGERSLCAYIVTNSELEVPRLREFLSASLPDYMIPSYFIAVKEIPLTPNGKVDRKALLNIEGSGLKPRYKYVEPESELEKTIAETWKSVLKLDNVGTEDNFFDLGGTSLKMTGVINKLKESLNREIPAVTMFRYPTIASLVDYLNRETPILPKKSRVDIQRSAKDRLDKRRNLRKRP